MVTFELSIDITYKCPFSCPFCSTPQSHLLPDMKLDTALKCLDFGYKSCKNEPIMITITGGEPLILDTLPKFMSMWNKDNTIIRLCTTAAINVGKNYWRELYSYGLKTIFLSLHCISNTNCKNIFGDKYSFAIVDQNLEWIMATGMDIYVNFVFTKLNANAFDEVVNYCIKKRIKKIRILGLAKQGKANINWDKIAITKSEIEFFLKKISERFSNSFIKLEFAGLPSYKRCTHVDKKGKCPGGRNFFHINTNGDIYPCPSVKAINSEKIGSVFHSSKIFAPHRFYCETNRVVYNNEDHQI